MARPTSIEFKDVQKACEDALAADELRIPIVRDRSVQFDVITSSDSY